jgi:ribonuclease Z
MVMGPPRQGIKVAYCTDTRPVDTIAEHAKGADLFICEGMYAEPDKLGKAKQYKHMTFYEAAALARDAQVAEMWLTHFSPSLVGAKGYMKEVKKIFPNAFLGEDGKMVELDFKEG